MEFTFNQLTINPIKMEKTMLPKGYKKYNISFNGENIEVYKYNKDSNFALIYGIDVTTGEEKLYQIDLVNNTVQEFNDELLLKLDDSNNKFLIVFAVEAGIIFLEFIIIIISKKKNKKILNRIKNNRIEKVKEKAIEESKQETISINVEDVKKASKEKSPLEKNNKSKPLKNQEKKKSKK